MIAEIGKEEQVVTAIAEKYVQAFKEVKPQLVNDYFSPECVKIGFIYDFENDKWLDKSIHNYKEIKQWAATYNLKKIMPNGTCNTTLLDLQDKIAVVKIELEWAPRAWGCDYVSLSKDNGNWLITSIMYQTIV